MKHRFIAVEGPIGVGKTTLATRLARSLEMDFLSDTEADNPYLERFYKNPRQHAFHAQSHFLLSRIALLNEAQKRERTFVSDFLLDKDRLFAELTLDDDEMWMYQQMHAAQTIKGPRPDLVIYLQAPVAKLISRIEKRGLRFEQRIDSTYLQGVVDIYETFFHNFVETPLLVVNASDINIAENQRDYDNLLTRITEIGPGRHYLNPIAETS